MLRIGRSSARASTEAKAKSKSEATEFGEEGWPVGAVLLTMDMLRGGKDGPNFGVGMCSEIWLRWEGPPLYSGNRLERDTTPNSQLAAAATQKRSFFQEDCRNTLLRGWNMVDVILLPG